MESRAWLARLKGLLTVSALPPGRAFRIWRATRVCAIMRRADGGRSVWRDDAGKAAWTDDDHRAGAVGWRCGGGKLATGRTSGQPGPGRRGRLSAGRGRQGDAGGLVDPVGCARHGGRAGGNLGRRGGGRQYLQCRAFPAVPAPGRAGAAGWADRHLQLSGAKLWRSGDHLGQPLGAGAADRKLDLDAGRRLCRGPGDRLCPRCGPRLGVPGHAGRPAPVRGAAAGAGL